jgi:hypothetical protein
MPVEVVKPQQQTSIGRRLLGMAAPIVGGAVGGVGGAIAGQVIGGKLSGQSSQAALLGGAEAGVNSMGQQKPQETTSITRRNDALSQKPDVAINEGLNALALLPKDDPLRQQYTGPLVQAQMVRRA